MSDLEKVARLVTVALILLEANFVVNRYEQLLFVSCFHYNVVIFTHFQQTLRFK